MPDNNSAYKIEGGHPIKGKIKCMGAKNFATKAMVAALLSNEKTTLHNVPKIGDVEITISLLESAGVKVEWLDEQSLIIHPYLLSQEKVSLPDSRTNRIPILLLSILLNRFGKAIVPTVGGDDIGKRNVNFHINAVQEFGANIEKVGNTYVASIKQRLEGCHITLAYPSVGATETCLFLSVLARGTSVIKNIAVEPEIIELIAMLRSMGAIIFFGTSRELIVRGVEELNGTNIYLIGDRIEAASWACLACASDGEIEVSGIRHDLLSNFLSYYTESGGGYKIVNEDSILFYRKNPLSSVIIETDVFPGFSTDWQQPFVTLLTQAEGMSVIHETVYEQRFGYLQILNKLGANTQVVSHCLGSSPCRYAGYDHEHSAIIKGHTTLSAIDESIAIPDLRAGLAYLIAATLAKGTTTLRAINQIERGYGNLLSKLKNTNMKITSVLL